MSQGWIKVHRQIKEHYLFKEKRVFSKFEAWMDILLMANHADNKFILGNELIELKKGQFITSELKLMSNWNWSKSKVRSFLSLLQSDSMIVLTTDKKKTTLTVVKYGDYQVSETTEKPQRDHKRTTSRPQADTNNNDKNDNNENNDKKNNNNINERKLKFAESLKDFVPIYGRDMIKEFYDYWSEPNKSNTKFKQEMQATWSLESRLRTWSKNNEKFNTFKNGISTKQTMDERIAEAKRRASEKRSGQMPSIWSEPESFSDYETL